MIEFKTPQHHWNYYLALERDLENISRYIEFSDANLSTYSIELTHILLSASSEVDVILKQICQIVEPTARAVNILDYQHLIQLHHPTIINEEVSIYKFKLSFKPWETWDQAQSPPNWWTSHNRVKHQRNNHFAEANLRNAINAVGALLIVVTHYYQLAFTREAENPVSLKETTSQLDPGPTFLRINADYYHKILTI